MKELEKMTTAELINLIRQKENGISDKSIEYFEPNHILEVYLYEFYCKPKEYKVINEGIHLACNTLADKLREAKDYKKAEEYINKSLNYNCADIESYELYIKILYEQEKWREMIDTALKFFPFCYTRKDIAYFYRTIACYALETYQAKLARVIYSYSNLFYKSQNADAELKYLNEALGNEMDSYTLEQMRDIIKKNSLPDQPRQETLAILYKTALMEQKENSDYAKMLFFALYQLTQDKEIEERLKELS